MTIKCSKCGHLIEIPERKDDRDLSAWADIIMGYRCPKCGTYTKRSK